MIIKIKPARVIKTFAYVRSSTAKYASPNYASRFYDCDGIADDVQIQDALNNFDLVILSDGTFNITAQLTGTSSLYGQGIGVTIIEMGSLATQAINFGGSSTQVGGDSEVGIVSAGSTTITTSVNRSADLSVGDYFFIASSQNYNPERGQYTKAEWCQVKSISGTTITLEKGLEFSYESGFTRRLYKANLVSGVELQGFTLNYGTASNTSMLVLTHCINARVRDVKLDGGATNKLARIGIQLNNCVDSWVENSIVNNVNDTGNSLQIGYGYYLTGCYNCGVYDCYGEGNKHLTDADKANYQPYSQYITFKKIVAGKRGGSAPFSTHGGAIDVVFDDVYRKVTALDVEDGSFVFTLVRSCRTTFQNSELDAVITNSFVSAPLIFGANRDLAQGGTGNNGDGVSNNGLIVRNNIINVVRNTGAAFISSSQGNFIRIVTSGVGMVIENNTFFGLQNHGIDFEGNLNSDIVINNNSFEFYGHRAGQYTAYFTPQTGSLAQDDITFTNNTVVGAQDISSPYVRGAVSITNLVSSGNSIT